MADGGGNPRLKPNRLSQAIRGAKGGGSQRTPVEAPDTLNSTAHAHILDLLGEGEFAGFYSDNPLKDTFLDETPVMNEDGTLNFTDVYMDWRLGTQDQPYMKGFPSVSNETLVGVELKAATPWTRAINNIQLSAIRVRLSVAALSKTNSENGDINGHSISYAIDLKVDDGAFIEVLSNAMTGKTNTKYERTHRLDLPQAATGWTVRVRRLTPDTEAANIQDTTYVESFTEIIDVKMRYPNSAYVGIKLNAAQFRSIPGRAFRMLGRLMRVPSNYDPVAGTYTGIWDGTFQMAWTRNPAWIFYDLVTNERFGLGQYVNESQIDKWSLYKIAQYCDELVPDGKGGTEPRFTCTVYLQRQEEAYKVLQDLASVFRGISYWGNGAVIPVGDMPRDPVYTYTNANVKEGKFSYQGSGRKARHTVALVSWSDPSDFNRQKVEYVEDEEAIARYGYQPTQITAVGCTSQGQAQRVGRWLLLTEKHETNTVTFAVGLDQILALPGQVINVADAKRAGRRTGGRISSATMNVGANTSQVVVDAMPVVAIGDDLICILPSGAAQKRPVTAIVGNAITVSPRFDDNPIPESIWAVESPTLKTQLYSVISIGEGEGLTAVITALQHEPGKFDAVDNGTYIEERPTTSIASAVQRPPTNLIVTAAPRAGYVLASTVVNATWTAAEGAVSYDVQWRRSNGEWSAPQKVLGTQSELFNAFPGEYVCMVSARNSLGIVSIPAISETFIVNDQSLAPGFVDDINADITEALNTAQNAQATADGAIEFFWQDSPPVIGSLAGQAKVGDFWVDTNDGNRMWRATGGVWVDAQDDQIGQALLAAQTAQGTADGKVKTFFGTVEPVAESVGDLWFNTVTKKLHRWSGTDWNLEISDVTLDQLGGSGVNIMPEEYTRRINLDIAAFHRFGATPATVSDSTPTGYAFRFETTGTDVNADWAYFAPTSGTKNIPVQAGKYLFSYYAKAGVAGHQIEPRIVPNAGGVVVGSSRVLSGNYQRYTDVVEFTDPAVISTNVLFYLNRSGVAGRHVFIDRIMLEPMIGNLAQASAWAAGQAGKIAIDAIAAASAAQDTADGKITSYYQATAPAGASLGDLWIDTDDKNKLWRFNGTAWVESQDDAISDAINAAAGAQATADGKVTTFYSASAPVAEAVGDLWYNTTAKNLSRWNGSAWIQVGDITADKIGGTGVNLLWDEYTHFKESVTITSTSNPAMQYALIGQIITVADDTAFGGFSLRILTTADSATQYVRLGKTTTDHNVKISGNRKYLLSYYAKSGTSGHNLRPWVRGAATIDGSVQAVTGGYQRYSQVFDLSGVADGEVSIGFYVNTDNVAGRYVYFDRIMFEPLEGNVTTPSSWSPGPSSRQMVIAIANAAYAQATADGKITLFKQSTAPSSGFSEGDIWIRTTDNVMHVREGSAWVVRQDSAIGQALNNAATAQSTADGKITTFYSTTTPTAEAVGDLWYNKNTMELKRWSGSAWLGTDGAPSGGSGENMLTNPDFTLNKVGTVSNGLPAVGEPLSDGWYCYQQSNRTDSDVRWYDTGLIRLRSYGTEPLADGGTIVISARTLNFIPVEEGRQYRFSFTSVNSSYNGTIPSGVNIRSRLTIRTYDAASAQISYAEVATGSRANGTFTGTYTVPAGSGVTKISLQIEGLVQNVSGASWTHNSNVALNTYIKQVSMVKINDMDTEVNDGDVYGRFSVLDRFASGGVWRIGMRIPGSGHRIGDQRNLPQSNTAAYGSVRTTTALSATSAGVVSVNAHTLRYGGVSISYSAVASAVTGLTQGSTYVIYCFDDAYAGGVRTWYAGSNPAAVMALGDGVVVAGQITIPTSGSSSGGGGGSGTDPGDWCVDYDTVLPDGRYVRDLRLGDLVECIDVKTGEVGMFPLLGMGFGEEECYRLVTADLCSVIQSKSTPMDLPDGQVVRTPDMFGKPAYHKLNDEVKLSFIADLQFVGLRRVCKPDFGNRMFFAGESASNTLATHNATAKP